MITGKAGSSEGVSLFSFKINDNLKGNDRLLRNKITANKHWYIREMFYICDEQEEPYEGRLSRTVPWERRGESPLRDPTSNKVKKRKRTTNFTNWIRYEK